MNTPLSHHHRLVSVCVWMLAGLTLAGAWADQVILKTGGRVEGEIIEDSEERVQVNVEGLGVIAIDRRDVSQVIRSTQPPVATARAPQLTATPVAEAPRQTPTPLSERPSGYHPPTATNTPLLRLDTTRPETPPTATATATPPLAPSQGILEPQPERAKEPLEAQPPGVSPEQGPGPSLPQEEERSGFEEQELEEPEPLGLGGPLDILRSTLDEMQGNPWLGVAEILWRIAIIYLCIRIGEKRGHSTLACVLYGLIFGIIGLILCSLEPSKAKIAAIGCCGLIILFSCLIGIFFTFFAAKMAGELSESQPQDFGQYDQPEEPPAFVAAVTLNYDAYYLSRFAN